MPLFVKLLTPTAMLPTQAHTGDAGLDLYADEDAILEPGSWRLIKTGIALAMDSWMVGLVCPRSGLAKNYGVTVLNAPGIVDSGYRGEVGVILYNGSATPFEAVRGSRIAQLVLVGSLIDHETPVLEVVNLPTTSRGAEGFGSTGT